MFVLALYIDIESNAVAFFQFFFFSFFFSFLALACCQATLGGGGGSGKELGLGILSYNPHAMLSSSDFSYNVVIDAITRVVISKNVIVHRPEFCYV